ncbi:MAG: hypothetical protein ACLPRH_17715, partial [Syntrophobacteraceae bacterium]
KNFDRRASCKSPSTSFRRRPESRFFKVHWTADVTGVTVLLSSARGSGFTGLAGLTGLKNCGIEELTVQDPLIP